MPGQLQHNVARQNVDTVDARRTRPHIRGEEIRAGLINDNWARALGYRYSCLRGRSRGHHQDGKDDPQRFSQGTKKKHASKSSHYVKPFTTEQLCHIWEKILSDTDGRRALEQLDKAGFPISHFKPRDATFQHPSWADYLSALPLLPDEPSRIPGSPLLRCCLRSSDARIHGIVSILSCRQETEFEILPR